MRDGEVSTQGSSDRNGVIVPCAGCSRANRLPFSSLGKTARCGHCKAPIVAPSSPIEIGDSAVFDEAANKSALPLLVDFWAPWCGPCRMVAPEVNTDVVTDVAARFSIRSIPTLALVFGGREIDRVTGVRPASEIEAFAARALAAARSRAS